MRFFFLTKKLVRRKEKKSRKKHKKTRKKKSVKNTKKWQFREKPVFLQKAP
jgi:hypothetical protein